jgi:4-amino-4-deoxy-L-arabinose transferase-like glycosyltransferase
MAITVLQRPAMIRQRSIVLGIWMLYVLLALATIRFHNENIAEPSDAYYFLQIAHNIAQGKGFLEQYNHAYRPPLFPAYLSLLILCGVQSVVTLKLITVFVLSSSVILMYLLGRSLFGGYAGVVGAFLAAVSPWLITMPNLLMSENLFLPLFLLFLLATARAVRNPSPGAFVLAGIASGLGTLTREILIFAPLLFFIVMAVRAGRRSAVKAFAIVAACHTLVISPWTIRNYSVFHKFIPVSTNSWINLYMGNNPRYENIYSFNWIIPEGTRWNVREQPGGSDEYAVMAQSRSQALAYIREHPKAFAGRFFKKTWRFITPHFDLIGKLGANLILKLAVGLDLALYTVSLLLFIAYCAGRLRRIRRTEPFLLFCLLFVVFVTVVAGVTHTNSRYRLPATMIFMVYAAYYGNVLVEKLMNARAGGPSAPAR